VLAVQPGGVGDGDEKLHPKKWGGGSSGAVRLRRHRPNSLAAQTKLLAAQTNNNVSTECLFHQQSAGSKPCQPCQAPTWLPLVFLPALAMDRTPGA
jgi:hypothetical protein